MLVIETQKPREDENLLVNKFYYLRGSDCIYTLNLR